MDRAYREYFRTAASRETPFEERTARVFPTVGQAIQHANMELLTTDRVLRADADQLLKVNLIEVVAPIVSVGRDGPRVGLFADIDVDVATIVREAARRSSEREISGHAIIDAVAATWPQLRLMRPEVWG